MFKPVCVLQIAIIAVILGGCASPQTVAVTQTPETTQIPSGSGTIAQPGQAAAPGTDRSPEPATRVPGMPQPGTNGFLTRNGKLLPDIQEYAMNVSQERGIPLEHVTTLLKEAHYNATVARLMTPSPTRIRRSWVTYRNRFVEPVRIKAGVQFWEEHRAALDRTTKQFGVPASIIVAIIGVETVYGRNMGNFRVLDALATLGFRHPDPARPERSQLFRDQLADLIQLDNRRELNARTAQGSYAGAMGIPQFMPGSLLRYALDGDNDKQVNLTASADDAIVSVANFLRRHGWQPGLPVFAPVKLPADARRLVKGGLEPTYSWEDLRKAGATEHPSTIPDSWKQHLLGVVDLLDEPRNTAEYRSGTPNFFALTHYNRSYFYAASVADLAEALARRTGYGAP